MIRKVILESPYKGDVETNLRYARACLRDCALRGESALASHLLWTQEGVLDDAVPEERQLGIELGLVWGSEADATVIYVDLGITKGMRYGIRRADKENRKIEYRTLDDWVKSEQNMYRNAAKPKVGQRASKPAGGVRFPGSTPNTRWMMSISRMVTQGDNYGT